MFKPPTRQELLTLIGSFCQSPGKCRAAQLEDCSLWLCVKADLRGVPFGGISYHPCLVVNQPNRYLLGGISYHPCLVVNPPHRYLLGGISYHPCLVVSLKKAGCSLRFSRRSTHPLWQVCMDILESCNERLYRSAMERPSRELGDLKPGSVSPRF